MNIDIPAGSGGVGDRGAGGGFPVLNSFQSTSAVFLADIFALVDGDAISCHVPSPHSGVLSPAMPAVIVDPGFGGVTTAVVVLTAVIVLPHEADTTADEPFVGDEWAVEVVLALNARVRSESVVHTERSESESEPEQEQEPVSGGMEATYFD